MCAVSVSGSPHGSTRHSPRLVASPNNFEEIELVPLRSSQHQNLSGAPPLLHQGGISASPKFSRAPPRDYFSDYEDPDFPPAYNRPDDVTAAQARTSRLRGINEQSHPVAPTVQQRGVIKNEEEEKEKLEVK